MKKEIINKQEADGRKIEANKKKNKKRDFRKWANKYLKPGEMPPKTAGWGEGTVLYCPDCDLQALKATHKDKWTCNHCGAECISMSKTKFKEFRNAQTRQKENREDI